jgi:sugar/nucleoside kinase (ribokinase family)
VTAGAAGTAFCAAHETSDAGKDARDGEGDRWDVVWVPTIKVRVVNPIGAGDSFVGGLVEALEEGRTGVDAVVFAVATATASVEQELAGGVDPRRAREIAALLAGRARPESALPTGGAAGDSAARAGA